MTDKQLSLAERDAHLIGELSRLPSFSPSPGFRNRVMARVAMPKPRIVRLAGRARAWALEPRRALVLAGAYAASAVIALGVVVPWLYANSPAISFAADWAGSRVLGMVREIALGTAAWMVSSGVSDLLKSLSLSGGRLLLAVLSLTVGYAGCAAGLHYLLRAPRGKDARIPVSL